LVLPKFSTCRSWVASFRNGISQRMDVNQDSPVGFCSFTYQVSHAIAPLARLTPVLSNTYSYRRKGGITGTPFALLYATIQDWLPGVAGTQPRLGFRFRGVSSGERGLAPAPFFICPGGLAETSREWVVELPSVVHSTPARVSPPSSNARTFINTWQSPTLAPSGVVPVVRAKKMSGRWGDRPLGRGEWRVRGLKSVRFFVPRKARGRSFRCAREQQYDTQEQTTDNHR
jgi:hypothetical protein